MAYEAKILADSVSPGGHRLTTFQITFPRIVLAEINTHCMLSKSSASSRAIPVAKRIDAVRRDPFIPKSFGKNRPGMQATEQLELTEGERARRCWEDATQIALSFAHELSEIGVHKQLANRLLEPFSWHTAIVTGTDWSNFFNLRDNPDAQGEFQEAASMMRTLYDLYEPRVLKEGEWHLPLVTGYDEDENVASGATGIELARVSAARCARVSYLTHEGVRDVGTDVLLYGKLRKAGHMSPFEHTARPMTEFELDITRAWDVQFEEKGPMLRVPEGAQHPSSILPGAVVQRRGPLNYCGKLNGWCSLRSMIPNEWDILGNR